MLIAQTRPVADGSRTPQTVSDEVLIRRIAAGDKNAMRTLWERLNVRVYQFVTRIVRDAALAEDVTSDAFLEMWRRAGQFEGRSSAASWILGIARYKALSACRVRMRAEAREDVDAGAAILDPARDPEAELQVNEVSEHLLRCVANLPRQHAEIIELIYYRHMSIHEVAKRMGIPENTVRTRAFYARAKLAALLPTVGIDRSVLATLAAAA